MVCPPIDRDFEYCMIHLYCSVSTDIIEKALHKKKNSCMKNVCSGRGSIKLSLFWYASTTVKRIRRKAVDVIASGSRVADILEQYMSNVQG